MKPTTRYHATKVIAALVAASAIPSGLAADRNVDGIMDNSFLVEEAYNQEAGVVQHIFTGMYSLDKMRGKDDQAWDFSFTQEWPVFSQTHQFSYTIPYSFTEIGGITENGIGDMLLNYRYQAYFSEETLTAFAPRVSAVLPTGDDARGLGDDTLGLQVNLPFSTAISDDWFVHLNAGMTFLPDAASGGGRDLMHYSAGASLIYAATPDLHFMLEWVAAWDEGPNALNVLDHDFSTLISPGVRKAFNFANDAQLVVGLATPIGLTGNAPDFGAFVYVSFEHFFKRE